jgi:hypothetical protein
MGVRMVAVGFVGLWAFYGLGTWGWCLVKGYNITFAEWFNPLKPYQWNGTPALVPKGSMLPTGKNATGTAAKVRLA